jgi:2-dehydro-3-deoxygluconokinase
MKRVVCYGEMLLRLAAPGKEPLLRSACLAANFCGAEANVAVSLAHFGLDAAAVTVLPDNALGDACLGELRRHGVDTAAVRRAAGRMGLYYLSPGAMLRPAQIVYDRTHSAFAGADPAIHDWRTVLTGADWLHVTGITPALSKSAEKALLAATAMATELGVSISFDCNFRPALWHGREQDAPRVLRALAEQAQLLFGGVRDVALLFGADFSAAEPVEGFRRAAEAVLGACPKLRCMAATHRIVHTAEHNELTGYLADRAGLSVSGPTTLNPIVDRIGSGDAFAAGLLFGLCEGLGRERAVEFALTAAALKHSLPGDFNVVSAREVHELLQSGSRDVRR